MLIRVRESTTNMEKQKSNFRPPVVTLMGHVDHGKTTLLDAIRKTNVVAKEHGGITQHIGAYQINFRESPITFIDTPGHAAFEKMRSRGAEVADIVILVVAATEGVKPQTQEAIKHIKAAKKPVIVALTKVDLPNINFDKVKKELQKEGINIEEFGGDVPVVQVAAPKGKGLEDLLEVIQLVWQLSPAPSESLAPLEAVVVETFLDKNCGPVVTAVVKMGKLKVGQKISVDGEVITVRALIDDSNQRLEEALPGKPVEILGFKKILDVGSILRDQNVLKSASAKKPATLAEIIAKSQEAKDKFKAVIKADVFGSLEAIEANLPPKVLVVLSGVGEVTQADVSFAKAASAPILAFNVKTLSSVKNHAEREGVIIKNYQVIYDLISDMEEVISGFEQAKHESKIAGRAKVVAMFEIDGKKIAGAIVTGGRIKIGDTIHLNHLLSKKSDESQISSLKRFKKDVESVNKGQECGIGFAQNIDFEEGDIIESLG